MSTFYSNNPMAYTAQGSTIAGNNPTFNHQRKPAAFLRWFFILLMMSGFANNLAAQTNGIYESYAILSLNGGANAFYDMNAITANPDFQGSALGSYNASNSLVVKGGQNKTLKTQYLETREHRNRLQGYNFRV